MLSSLWNTVKSTASKAINTIGNYIPQVGAASAILSTKQPDYKTGLDYNTPANKALSNNQTIAPNMTVMPTATDPGGPGYMTSAGPISYNNPALITKQQQTGQIASTGSVRPSTAQKKTSTEAERTDSSGRTSTKEQGNPYYQNGKLIIPDASFSGISGAGGGGLTSSSTASTGATGATGTGARGYLGAGGGTMSSLLGQPNSDEEQRKSDDGTQVLSATDKGNAMMNGVAPALVGGTPTPPSVPEVKDVIDAGFISEMTQAIQGVSSYSGADRNQVILDIGNKLKIAYDNLAIQAQNEGPLVEDTSAQKMFFDSLSSPEESLATKQAVDNWKAQFTDLNELTSQRQLLRKQISATDEIFLGQINEIKDNPNLPKALARRKVTDLLSVNERAMKNVMSNLEDIEDRIETQQQNVNLAFQIKEDAQNQEERVKSRLERQINRYIDNPTLIAGLNPKDLQALSGMSGYSTTALKKLADTAMEKEIDRDHVDTPQGDRIYYDAKTGQELFRLKGVVKKDTGSTSGASGVDTYAQAFLDGQIDITSVPQDQRAQVLQKANELATAALNQSTQTTTQGSSTYKPTAREVGAEVLPTLKSGYASYANTVTKVADGITSFFGGLITGK